ncbi:MAG: ABC transporter permease [Acidobacteria bacterium]|nr:ABC transporter permease [Acidobacteriota bacterium]MBK9526928.1 ABC transporter permease [Acidobacteriota bacterium]
MRQIYSFYFDAFWIALKSILEHKLRAFLTLIGIIIGVAAVVVVGASISGLNSYVTEKVSKVLGSNHFMMARMAFSGPIDEEEFERRNRLNKRLTMDEYEYLKANCSNCSEVGAQMQSGTDLNENGVEMPSVRIIGVTANMIDIEEKEIELGRFISDGDVERGSKSAVIGYDIKDKFFPNSDPIGQVIRVRGVPMQIVGLEERRGSMFGNSMDRQIYIPLTQFQMIFNRADGIQIHGKSQIPENFESAIEEARTLLRNKRQLIGSDEDTFGVVNTKDLGNQIDQFTAAIAGVVVPITLITLIVGGIVVMNIMLVSVTERTFEVGLRKAIGATRKQILLQFLIESALLCIVGGIVGLLLAAGVTQLITILAGITMTITITYIILSVGVSTFIGVVAGLYPAWKAARLDPIVALTQN